MGCQRFRASLLLMLIACLPAVSLGATFEYCFMFRGACQNTCSVGTIELSATFLCSGGIKCCIKAPPATITTTTRTTTTTPFQSPFPTCGLPGAPKKKVVGGTDTVKCEYPWMVYIARSPNTSDPCGGSVLDSRHILTAAHCFENLGTYVPNITLGEHNRSETAPNDKFTTKDYKVIFHPNYDSYHFFNDLAILRLNNPIDLKSFTCIQPLCLPSANQIFPVGTECVVAGWGITTKFPRPNVPIPDLLQKASLSIVDESLCRARFGIFYNTSIQACAGELGGLRDACQGDSGSPLFCQARDGPQYLAVGIVSSGDGCANLNTPAIYTEVAAFVPWIHSVMAEGALST